MKNLIFFIALIRLTFYTVYANPESADYKLQDYTFGAGGANGSSSTDYKLFGVAGQIEGNTATSDDYKFWPGLLYTMMANVPGTPTFTNPSNNYDRLKIVINTSNNPSDTTFAIAITENSDTNWTNIRYVQSDGTVGTTLGIEDFQTYSSWGGASGSYITGLTQNTTYKVKVKARQGNYTESGYGPVATATTSDPSLTFGISASSITFANLNSGNSYTDSSKSTVFTTSTNAYNGYIIYGRVTQPLTFNSYTIANYSGTNSTPTTWTGTGFGYTTDDNNLVGGTADRFTNGGPKYAGFGTTTPGEPVADTAGPVLTAISNEQFTVSYRITTEASTVAGTYDSTIIYVIVPTY